MKQVMKIATGAALVVGAAVVANGQGIEPTNSVDIAAGFTALNGYVQIGAGLAFGIITTLLGLRVYNSWGNRAARGRA